MAMLNNQMVPSVDGPNHAAVGNYEGIYEALSILGLLVCFWMGRLHPLQDFSIHSSYGNSRTI